MWSIKMWLFLAFCFIELLLTFTTIGKCIHSRFQQVHKKLLKKYFKSCVVSASLCRCSGILLHRKFIRRFERDFKPTSKTTSKKVHFSQNVGIFMSSEVSTECSMKVHQTFVRQQKPEIWGFFFAFLYTTTDCKRPL